MVKHLSLNQYLYVSPCGASYSGKFHAMPMEPHALENNMHYLLKLHALEKPFSLLSCGVSYSGNSYALPCRASCSRNLHIIALWSFMLWKPPLQVLILRSRKNPTILHWPWHLLVYSIHSLSQTHLFYGFKQHTLGPSNTFITLPHFKQLPFYNSSYLSPF